MKHLFNLLIGTLALCALFGCRQAQPDGSQYLADPELGVSTGVVQLNPEGGSATITVESTEPVMVSVAQTWLSVSTSGNLVTFSAKENKSLESRYSSVTLMAGKASRRIQVFQFGYTSDKLPE